jgi:two-component system chemotaxis response regulator CheY
MRILIAEDDRSSRRLLKINLVAAGYEVVEAEDGQKAWDALQQEHFRLVITDWMMPVLSGLQLIQRIRTELKGGYVYTIIVTALEDKSHVIEGLDAGADDYLSKPFYSEELLARIKIGERILTLEDGLREAEEQMEHQAMHDALTGLLNRRAIQKHALAEVNRAERSSTQLSILLMDLDHFKLVNDRYGHAAGDQALQLFAGVLLASVRPYDWVGRWGGEEFLCVLPGAALNDAGLVAERIRLGTEQLAPPATDQGSFKLTVSIGVASAENVEGTIQLDNLVRAADLAMYKAKSSGRNQVCLAD